MKRRSKLIVAVLVAAAIATGAYSMSLMSSESVYSKRGSFAYWLTISRVIKEVPEINPSGTVQFYASAGDGPKLPESAVAYRSHSRPDDILRDIRKYLTDLGYRARDDGSYVRGTSVITLEITTEGAETKLNVRENY